MLGRGCLGDLLLHSPRGRGVPEEAEEVHRASPLSGELAYPTATEGVGNGGCYIPFIFKKELLPIQLAIESLYV